jgi:hypothetical protein
MKGQLPYGESVEISHGDRPATPTSRLQAIVRKRGHPLSEDEILAIRRELVELCRASGIRQADIGAIFRVSQATASRDSRKPRLKLFSSDQQEDE